MDRKQQIKVLDKAIRAINRYDKHIKNKSKLVSACGICDLIPKRDHEYFAMKVPDCKQCPFSKGTLDCNNKNVVGDSAGVHARACGYRLKSWQNELIKRLKAWCKKNDVGFVVEKISKKGE